MILKDRAYMEEVVRYLDTTTDSLEVISNNIYIINDQVRDADDLGLMHYAAISGSVKAIQTLHDLGMNVNIQDDEGLSPITYVYVGDNYPAAKKLAELGADLYFKDVNNETLLERESENENIDRVLDLGFNINFQDYDCGGGTALHYNMRRDDLAGAKHLLKRGAKLDIFDENGFSPFDHLIGSQIFNDKKVKFIKDVLNSDYFPEDISFVNKSLKMLLDSTHINRVLFERRNVDSYFVEVLKILLNYITSKDKNFALNITIKDIEAFYNNNHITVETVSLEDYLSELPALPYFIAYGVKFDIPKFNNVVNELKVVTQLYVDAIMSDPKRCSFGRVVQLSRSNTEVFKQLLFSNRKIPDYLAKRFYEYDGNENNLIDILAETILRDKFPNAQSFEEGKLYYTAEKLCIKVFGLYSKDANAETSLGSKRVIFLEALVPLISQYKDRFDSNALPQDLEILLSAELLNAMQTQMNRRQPDFRRAFERAAKYAFEKWAHDTIEKSQNPEQYEIQSALKQNCRVLANCIMTVYEKKVRYIPDEEKNHVRKRINRLIHDNLSSIATTSGLVHEEAFLIDVGNSVLNAMLSQHSNNIPNFDADVETAVNNTISSWKERTTIVLTLPAASNKRAADNMSV